MRRAVTGSLMTTVLVVSLVIGLPLIASGQAVDPGDVRGGDVRGGDRAERLRERLGRELRSRDRFALEEATIADVQEAFAEGDLTCVGLVEGYLERIEAYEESGPMLNAITTVNPDALATAAELDAEYAAHGPRSRLHCIPVLLKDNIDTADMPTTNGSVILADAYPPDDAFITDALREQGALILGKASMGEFAGGPWSTLDGQMLNPYNLTRNTGGSSAGSASSVAANLTMLAVGTDTSTSVRGPAAYNGIVGLRPTTGLISRAGIAPKNLTYDTAGPMARTVTDTAIMMGALTGVDPADPKSLETYAEFPAGIDDVPANGIDYTGYLDDEALEGTTLGVMRDFFDGADPEVLALAEDALDVLEAQGATLVDVRIDPEFLDYDIGEDGGGYRDVADYRFYEDFQGYLETLGPDEDVPDTIEEMIAIYETEVAASDKPAATSVINLLKDSLEHSSADPAYQQLITEELPAAAAYKQSLFDDHDLDAMVFPYEASFASPVSNPVETIDDPTYVRDSTPQAAIFAGYSDPGFPGIVVPMGFGSQGLPMDLSFMGKPYSDGELLGYAYDYEQATKLRAPSPLTPPLD